MEQQAHVLNKFFSSVFTQEDVSQIPNLEKLYQNDPLENIHITAEMVLTKLKSKKIVNQLVQMESMIES